MFRTSANALQNLPGALLFVLACLAMLLAWPGKAAALEEPGGLYGPQAAAQTHGMDHPPAAVTEAPACGAVLWYFWREHCHYCRLSEAWLRQLESRHPGLCITRVEVIHDPAGRDLFIRMMRERGEQATSVPTFILEDRVWVGYSPVLLEDIEAEARARLAAMERGLSRVQGRVNLGPLGVVDVAGMPLITATVLIAFVDGFNPCSIWVLTVLLAMILGSRSRVRVAAVGLVFLLVTASIYGLFIVGLFTAFSYAGHLGWIRFAVAVLALIFGLINVKDFFAYKKGISLSIPDRFKPRIYRGGRAVREDRPLWATLAITVLLAGGVSLVELPCTAGFPVVWTTLATEAAVSPAVFAGLLAIYLLIYLGVELVIVGAAVVTMSADRMQEKHGRVLKLFGGMVMIALAVVILVNPAVMESLAGSLAVIAASLAASLAVLLAHRLWTRQ